MNKKDKKRIIPMESEWQVTMKTQSVYTFTSTYFL